MEEDPHDELFMLAGMDQDEIDQYRDQKDAVIFLVDCTSTMFARNSHNPDCLDSVTQVLKAALSFMKTKIITSDSDRIGMVLYNTGTTNNSLNFENIFVMMPLD